jgi:hypothetical protein
MSIDESAHHIAQGKEHLEVAQTQVRLASEAQADARGEISGMTSGLNSLQQRFDRTDSFLGGAKTLADFITRNCTNAVTELQAGCSEEEGAVVQLALTSQQLFSGEGNDLQMSAAALVETAQQEVTAARQAVAQAIERLQKAGETVGYLGVLLLEAGGQGSLDHILGRIRGSNAPRVGTIRQALDAIGRLGPD